ncbi:MAG TPA: DNA translocase FtsK 4TM domain-containing protein [Steroidobacteraceae bacterium]|nr:DNA translocase FtsK 4TM domain-containing protein [Steroidobacteraceae bacterium]
MAKTLTDAQAAEAKLDPIFARALREAAFWLLAALALVLMIALSSYDAYDRSFSYTGEPGQVGNLIGPLGAWAAAVLLLLFGWPAFLFPLAIAFSAWLGFKRHADEPAQGRATLALRTIGLVIALATSCGLATLHFTPGGLPAGGGGILGNLIGENLAQAASLLGATLLMLALWFASVQLYIGISWLAVMDFLGHWVLAGAAWIRRRSAASRDLAAGRESREARETAVREIQKKAASRTPPRIEIPAPPVPETSQRVEKEKQVQLFAKPAARDLPELKLLDDPPPREKAYSAEALDALSRLVEIKLRDFGVEVEVVAVQPGPVVTRFELKPAPGVKVSQISALAKDLARALSAISVRVVEVIPGKSVVGLEIPNESRELVTLGEIIRSRAYDELASPLALALGKDIGGAPVVADLSRMPHLLIAGTTGSGKSVAINAMVLSLLYKSTSEQVRLIMIDPKMLELSVYEGIPHLLAPVVTDMKQAANALRWCVAEMERRYQLMKALSVRNLGGFNRKVRDAQQAGKPIPDPLIAQLVATGHHQGEVPALEPLPFIVVVIDELADLMLIVGKKVEELVARLTQKARASGIHLVLATQRPSVDVITGLIKANIPARIAFQVSAKVDSRTILDQNGAESLLSHGDMLYLPPGTSTPDRVHGAFVSDREVHAVVESLKGGVAPAYVDEVLSGPQGPIPGLPDEAGEGADADAGADGEQDPLYDEAVRIVTETRRASVSGVQRRLKIGYNRAARLVESMEAAGLVGSLQSNGSREVLAPPPPES